ncbi:MAG: succinoglycan biosynthesis protein ExoM [Gammaproteobacteria bacterium]|jgi:succinoglycan biosynthesis protein ExoM|nr:succinoglycan biosynthesis protein ExoM [Gammaproteobacteria bacterium]
MKLTVCIATYRRNGQLDEVLDDLMRQTVLPDQVVVVDNDAAGGARAVIERRGGNSAPFRIDYAVQPERNIAKTRNRTVELAEGEWLAFVDDDERAPETWLQRLLEAAEKYAADGVLSPVEPRLAADAPDWIRKGRFYDFPHQPEGAVVPLNCMRFGNVLLRGDWLRAEPGPFDERYRLGTGEDGDLLVRLANKGARIIWSETAPVFEPVDSTRMSLSWLLRRAFSGGQEFGRQSLRGMYVRATWITTSLFFIRVVVQIVLAAALTLLCLPAGRHRAAGWLITVWANLGKLAAFWSAPLQTYN